MGARYDAMAAFYESVTGENLSDPATAGLLAMLPSVSDLQMLDLACGHGRVSRELARRGARVTAVDISEALVVRAREIDSDSETAISFRVADVAQPGALGDGLFHGAVCNHALADIDDLDGVLAEASRVLEPGAFFVFSLLHPCFPGWGANAPSSWPPGKGYFHEGWWLADNPGFRGRVGANHRKLSTYVTALSRHGLFVEALAEPEAEFARWPTEKSDADPVPVFLVGRCTKR